MKYLVVWGKPPEKIEEAKSKGATYEFTVCADETILRRNLVVLFGTRVLEEIDTAISRSRVYMKVTFSPHGAEDYVTIYRAYQVE